MTRLTIAFFGAPSFAAELLQKIIDDTNLPVELKFVVTQPDKKAGRKQIITPTPVKNLAKKYKIEVLDKFQVTSYKLQELDLVLLYAFGELIPAEMLKTPRWGFWNIHPSLLPLYRGPSPIAYPLLLGEEKTGVSLIEMDERLDHGKIIDQKEYSIIKSDTQETLKKRLSDIGYELFKKNIHLLIDGALHKIEQNHSKSTITRLLTKKDGFIPYAIVQKMSKGEPLLKEDIPPIIAEYYAKYPPLTTNYQLPTTYFNYFRALSPWPGIWTMIPINGANKRLKITGMELRTTNYTLPPFITHVQLEGKKEVDFETFKAAYRIF